MGVVVEHGQLDPLRGGSDEEVWKRGSSVVKRSSLGEQFEHVERSPPDTFSDWSLPKCIELLSSTTKFVQIARAPQELESDHVAGGDLAVPKRLVERAADARVSMA